MAAAPDKVLLQTTQLLDMAATWNLACVGDLDGLKAIGVKDAVHIDRPDSATRWTPVQYAAKGNWPAIVAWLRSRGADVHRVNEDGLTCAFAAAASGSTSTLELLISYHADVDVDYRDTTALEALCASDDSAAMLHGDRLACAGLLILAGASLEGYVGTLARPIMLRWASEALASHYGTIVVALGARFGRDTSGSPCVLVGLEGRTLANIAKYLRRSPRQVQRLRRGVWVWQMEAADETNRPRALSRGCRRQDGCFVV